MSRILLVTNDSWFFVSHRLPIALHALAEGHEVHVAAREDSASDTIRKTGCVFHAWDLSPRGQALRGELSAIKSLASILRSVRPDVLHLVTIKPVLYGGMLARWLRVPAVVYAISGLGAVFVTPGRRARLLRSVIARVYRYAIAHPNAVAIFQNPDDRQHLIDVIGIDSLDTVLIRGSGVDLEHYVVRPEPDGVPVVVMAARLLRDKGVFEFVEAARLLAERGMRVHFRLAGGPAEGNPAALSASEIDALERSETVELLGHSSDVARLFADAHVVALPSYREGLPKALLEAAACGRVVVTTDVPGCRDAIDPGRTGLLVEVRSATALADAIEFLLVNTEQRRSMGSAGRELAVQAFDIHRITGQHLAIYERLATA